MIPVKVVYLADRSRNTGREVRKGNGNQKIENKGHFIATMGKQSFVPLRSPRHELSASASPVLLCMRITWKSCEKAHSDSAGLV